MNKYFILQEFINKLKGIELFNPNLSGEYFNQPYEHIRLFNIFNDKTYQEMCDCAEKLCSKVDNNIYSASGASKKYAKIADMQANDARNKGYSFFTSEIFRNFVSKIFDLKLTRFFTSSCHLHEGDMNNPSVLGWPHTDLNICQFIKNESEDNYLNNMQYNNYLYTSANMDYNPDDVEYVIRSAAFLFYLNNKENLKNEDGGGTFIYNHENNHSMIKTIPPINNSLFLFKVSKKSFHGVQPSIFNRYVNVNWFHSDPVEFVYKNFNQFKDNIINRTNLFEDWDSKNPWNLEKSPNYKNFFKKPLKFTLSDKDLINT